MGRVPLGQKGRRAQKAIRGILDPPGRKVSRAQRATREILAKTAPLESVDLPGRMERLVRGARRV